MPFVGSGGGNAITVTSKPKKKKGGGGGINLPSLGIGNLAKTLGSIPVGLARIGTALAPGGVAAGDPASRLGKGLVNSVEGLGLTAAEIITLGKAPNPTAGVFGEDYRPRSFFEMAGDEGILPALFETVGTAALVGGGVSKLAKAGRIGRAANAAVTANRASTAGRLSPGSRSAVQATRAAEKAAEKAAGIVLPESRVAGRAGTIRKLDNVAHPYRALLDSAIRPVGRAAQAKVTGTLPDGAGTVDTTAGSPTALGATIYGRVPGPAETATRNLNVEEIPGWAKRAVDGPLERLAPALSAMEGKLSATSIRHGAYAERRRAQEASRRSTLSSPAVKASVDAAKLHLRGRRLPNGKRITSQQASEMVGAHLTSRLTGIDQLADDFGLRPALEQVGAIQSPIPGSLRTPELDAALTKAEEAWRGMDAERAAAMTDSRLGDRGIAEAAKVTPTKTTVGDVKKAGTELLQATKLRTENLPRETKRTTERIDRVDAQIDNLQNQLAKIEAQEAAVAPRSSTLANVKRTAYLQRNLALAQAKRVRIAEVAATRDELKRLLAESALPSQIQAAALDGRANRRLAKVVEAMDNPSVSRAPAVWKPLWGAIEAMSKAAEESPALAAVVSDIPKTLSAVLRYAAKRGFDPVHVSSISNAEVHRLVYGAVALGKKGRDLGKEMEGSFRKTRRQAFARTQSIEALVAGHVQVAHELNTNALVDTLESMSRAIPEGGVPGGWVEWDSLRDFIITGEKSVDGFRPAADGAKKMVPKQVSKALEAYTKDYSHWSTNAIGRITNPWRALVLTFSPRWYVNNFVGNMVMASVEGVRPQDWASAWRHYRKGFRDVPAVTGASLVSELGTSSLIPRGGIREAVSVGKLDGGVRGAVSEGYQAFTHKLQRANEVVDEIARAAVYEKSIRSGLSPEAALNRSFTALVDYHDLTPWQRQIVRSAVPFLSFQKGILKLLTKLPIDHPKAMAVMAEVGRLNQEMVEEMGLPDLYSGVVGNVNLRAFNPFQDAAQLTTPQGIASSINPFIDIAVRNALGAPEGGFAESFRMNEFGGTEPDTSLVGGVMDVGLNFPQIRAAKAILGDVADETSGVRELAKFFGASTYSEEQLAKIRERVEKSKARISGESAKKSQRIL